MNMSKLFRQQGVRVLVVIFLSSLSIGWLSSADWYATAFAQTTSSQPAGADDAGATQQLFLPMISRGENGQPTATPIPSTTPAPTATPSPTPTTAPTGEPQTDPFALFLEQEWRTSSAAMKKDKNGALHVGYYFYEGMNDGAPNYAIYATCSAGCDQVTNWAKGKLAADRDVIEVQLDLTSTCHPPLLIRADSTLFPGGKAYL